MAQHSFTALYAQYPGVVAEMEPIFTSHDFILALAQSNQRLYIEALYSYRDSPAPLRAVHARLSRHLRSLATIQHLGNVKSNNIFGKPSRCARWQKTG